ncbi:MAG TPA: DUF4115 domain-containing protein [Candidatus Marinimicrobia bacterium]|nr:DUF4115 domain-containing protein [Candidatus Neomarinimicrobiota bacterium]
MATFYEILKQSREAQGLTVEQISSRTKISKEIITAIESGDLKILPKTYMRLFLKAYSQELKLDPETILKNFEELLSESIETPPVPDNNIKPSLPISQKPEKPEKPITVKKQNRNFSTVIIVFVILVFLIAVLRQVLMDEKKTTSNTALPKITPTDTTQTIPPSSDLKVAVPKSELNLTITTKDSCWVRIVTDNRTTFEATLPPLYKKEMIAKEQFDMQIGRPASINLVLNGKDLGPVGVPGIPTRLVITKDGIIRRQSF